jgi:hypothetical protein
MMDDRLDEELSRAAQEYHRPPATPRDELWSSIQAARTRRRQEPRVLVLRPWLRWGLAAAALLLIGVALGRLTMRPEPQTIASTPSPNAPERSNDLAYRVAAAQYLTSTEALLTGFRAEARGGFSRPDTQFVGEARELLATTRLMLNSPVAQDARLKSLLEDLEVVLVQIAQLPAEGGKQDLQLITEGLDQRSVLLRLRAATPRPGTAARGAL